LILAIAHVWESSITPIFKNAPLSLEKSFAQGSCTQIRRRHDVKFRGSSTRRITKVKKELCSLNPIFL
jgi:hypothetical protein